MLPRARTLKSVSILIGGLLCAGLAGKIAATALEQATARTDPAMADVTDIQATGSANDASGGGVFFLAARAAVVARDPQPINEPAAGPGAAPEPVLAGADPARAALPSAATDGRAGHTGDAASRPAAERVADGTQTGAPGTEGVQSSAQRADVDNARQRTAARRHADRKSKVRHVAKRTQYPPYYASRYPQWGFASRTPSQPFW